MTKYIVAALFAMASVGAVMAQGFNARTGSWQFTITMKGGMPMQGVPPELQKQIEAELAKPQTSNSCVSAEDLKQLNLGRLEEDDDEDCKVTSSKITATTADITRQCTSPAFTETAHFEAPNPQTITGNVSRKGADGTTTITMSGKWVAAQCTD